MHDPRFVPRTAAAAVTLLLWAASAASADDPPVTIGGMTAEGLVLSTTGASISRSFSIINTQKEPLDVVVDCPRLIAPDSSTVDTKWDLAGQATAPLSAKIAGLGSALLTMTSELPVVGLYQGTLSLVYGDKRYPYTIKVTREASKPGVTVVGLSALAFAGGGANRDIDFSIKESSGAKAVLHAPRVLSLTRKLGDKLLQAPLVGVTFQTLDAKGQKAPVGSSLSIERNTSVPIFMQVPGAEPGEYAGTLHIASATGALDAVPFTFYVRRSGWICTALIAVGVALSSFLRWHAKSGRPRLILARRLLLLGADIDGVIDRHADPEDRDVLDAFKRRLQLVGSDADIGETAAVDATLKDINAKLSLVPVWSTLRRRIAAVQPSAAADAARSVLEDALGFLKAHENDAEPDVKAKLDDMRTALTKIDTEVREALTSEIVKTRAKAEAAATDLPADGKAQFKREVLDVLEAAEKATKLTPPDDKRARGGIDAATRAYARIVTVDLAERLVSVQRPANVAQADWDGRQAALRKDVERVASAATASEAVAAYDAAYRQYLDILCLVAGEKLSDVRSGVANDASAQARLASAFETLSRARIRLDQGDLGEARSRYDEAKAVIDDVAKQLPPAKSMSTPGAQPPVEPDLPRSAESPLGRSVSSAVSLDPPRERQARAWSSLARVDKDLKRRDRIVSLVTAVVAIFLGFYLIWMDNLTWGSAKDMAAAVFWGLGLHQLAGNVLFAKLDLEQFEKSLTGAGNTGATP